MDEPLWAPSEERRKQANLTRFLRETGFTDFESLYRWSVEQPEAFWSAVWRFCKIAAHQGSERVLLDRQAMPGARWFPDARLNFAENLLRYRNGREALVFNNERGERSALSYAELYRETARFADGLRAAGVNAGDRVAGFLPNLPEAVIAMLAATSLGAVWSSCSPDFGYQGALDRFGQIEPKILVTADGYFYNGKRFDSLEKAAGLAAAAPSIEKVVVVPYTQPDPSLDVCPKAQIYREFLGPKTTLRFAPLPFDHPAYILYSSGTTGKPKCIVHSAGGTLLQHLKELVLHTDLKPDDRIFYFTTCGWMMWNWLVSSLAVGATVALYDGSPFYPEPTRLWDVAEQEKLTVFGASAKYISAMEKAGLRPRQTHRLKALRAILSTGSPLAPESFDYVYGEVKSDVQLASICGGTDLISCFALGNPIAPVWRGELQTRGLGMDVAVVDGEGRPLPAGKKGELVCRSPFPSMPVGFWDDPKGEKYRTAYFERFPGVWHHGDYCELTDHGGMIVWGRSDAVLNPGGVRIGTAEIYRAVESLPEVMEACAIGQERGGDVSILLFVKLADGVALDEGLIRKIRGEIRKKASPRHVPAKVAAVADIPRTLNGKIAELAVKNVVHGRPVTNREALANPEALALFEPFGATADE